MATMELAVRVLSAESNKVDVTTTLEVFRYLAERDTNASKHIDNVAKTLATCGTYVPWRMDQQTFSLLPRRNMTREGIVSTIRGAMGQSA